jgi:carbon-monoxide dehydrogenase small subunit
MNSTPRITLVVDGDPLVCYPEGCTSLLRALRDGGQLAVKGACEQGECGSCTVVLDGLLVCSCLVAVETCEGSAVETARGLLRPDLADALARHGAVQCGFCTPGFVVTAEHALAARDPLERDDVVAALEGNLCRCTGYNGIVAAVLEVDAARRTRRAER